MKINSLIKFLILILLLVSEQVSAQNKTLEFRKDHTFKIAQFTDLHWDNNSPKCKQTIETIRLVLSAEKPDLVILTGDIVTAVSAKAGWLAVSQIFMDAKVPWAVTLGNHDAEPEITRDQIFEILATRSYFVGSKGPDLSGCGNYALPIKAVSYTHLRAHETRHDLVCRLLLEKKNTKPTHPNNKTPRIQCKQNKTKHITKK